MSPFTRRFLCTLAVTAISHVALADDDEVPVTVTTNRPATLQRYVETITVAGEQKVPFGAWDRVTTFDPYDRYVTVCTLPCAQSVPIGRYRVTGDEIITSSDFKILVASHIDVHAMSSVWETVGSTLIGVGIATLLVSGGVGLVNGIAAAITASTGIATVIAGIVIRVAVHTTVTTQ